MGLAIAQLIIEESPAIVGLIQAAFVKKNPGAPVPASEEVIAGFHQTFADSNAMDEMLKKILQAEIDGLPLGGASAAGGGE